MIMGPIIMLFVVSVFLISMIGSSIGNIANGGSVRYDEEAFQNYANQRYIEEFSSFTAYENNILLVFLTNEARDGYYTIAWVGDNLNSNIIDSFGNEYTAYGKAVHSSINSEYYEFSISSNLASVVDKMSSHISSMNLESSFKRDVNTSDPPASRIVNYSSLAINEETVNLSLRDFSSATEIPIVIVVDDMEDVFGKSFSSEDVFTLILLAVFAIIAISGIVKGVKQYKQSKNGDDSSNNSDNGGYSGPGGSSSGSSGTYSGSYNTGNTGSYNRNPH